MATPMIPGGPHANGGIPILVAPQQPYIPTSVSLGHFVKFSGHDGSLESKN